MLKPILVPGQLARDHGLLALHLIDIAVLLQFPHCHAHRAAAHVPVLGQNILPRKGIPLLQHIFLDQLVNNIINLYVIRNIHFFNKLF